MKYGQTTISSETQRLLVTIAVSIGLLWILARIRFQEPTAPSNAVGPVLAQLRPSASYDDLARAIADLRPIVSAAIVAIGDGSAFRISSDRAVTLLPDDDMPVIAMDRATRLAVIAVDQAELAGVLPWVPRILDYPRFFLVGERARDGIALRPIFAGTLTPVTSPYWGREVWHVPAGVDLPAGRFVFTTEGALAGMSIAERGQLAIVPAAQLLETAQRLAKAPPRPEGTLGVDVQPLTPTLAAAAGASSGVMVSAVDPAGPAAEMLAPTDVVVTVGERAIRSIDDWRAVTLRLAAGDTVSLHIRSAGENRDVIVTAASPPSAAASMSPADGRESWAGRLGLQLAAVNSGSRVVRVQEGSIAARAALQPGDLITAVGREMKPSPAQITRAFSALHPGDSLILAFSRGHGHHLVAIAKTTSGTP